MSQSIRPTRPGRPRKSRIWAKAQARLTAKVDLPTPPLPEAMATECLMPVGVVPAPGADWPPDGGALAAETAISTMTSVTPGWALRHFSISVFSISGTFGSEVVMASETLAVPASNATLRTRPNEMMSRLKPGYFTCLSASLMESEVTKIVGKIAWKNRRFDLVKRLL